MYSYNQPGRVTKQRLRSAFQPPAGGSVVNTDFDAAYAWDNQGRMTSQTYPMSGPVYRYQFDGMGRLSRMTENGTAMASSTYSSIGQLSSMTYDNVIETRTYNSLMQLQRLTAYQISVGNIMDMQYNYNSGANNGRIASSIDYVSGETVNYTYDALNRLGTATAGAWSQTYSYDGFGNLTGVNGAGVLTPDPATNRPGSPGGYDANGLPLGSGGTNAWDFENRLVSQPTSSGGVGWTYDPSGKRIQKTPPVQNDDNVPEPEIYFYNITGQRIATFDSHWDGQGLGWYQVSTNLYYAGKLIRSKGVTVATDRLGSVRANVSGERMRYVPYGQEITSTADNRDKFGTYFRDGQGQDYADQRYYNQAGSFWTPDPGGIAAADPSNPLSWNRYAYAYGDPINMFDPTGTFPCGAVWADDGRGNISVTVYDCNPGAAGAMSGMPTPVENTEGQLPAGGPNPDDDGPEPYRPECDTGNAKNATYLNFIAAHLADATKLAGQLGVSVADILGVAGEESTFGASNLAKNNNFFGLHNRSDGTPFPGQTGTYWTQPTDPKVKPVPTPTFNASTGFYDSGEVFVNREKPFLGAPESANPSTFASIIHQHGYGKGTNNYVSKTTSVINDFALRLDCPH
jgi:RHS repeat-associated protein